MALVAIGGTEQHPAVVLRHVHLVLPLVAIQELIEGLVERLDWVRAVENDVGTLATGVTFVVGVLAGHPRFPVVQCCDAIAIDRVAEALLVGVSIQTRKLRCAAHSERPADTPSMTTIGAGSMACHSANVSDGQSERW